MASVQVPEGTGRGRLQWPGRFRCGSTAKRTVLLSMDGDRESCHKHRCSRNEFFHRSSSDCAAFPSIVTAVESVTRYLWAIATH